MLAQLTLLEDHGHRTTLVQNTQLALGSLLVGGVGEDAAVQQGPVGVGHHGADVPRAVGLALLGVLQRVEVGVGVDRKSTRLNSSHSGESRMPSSA